MHSETFHLNKIMIDGKYIPDKYFDVNQPKRVKVNTVYIFSKKSDEILAGTKLGVFKTTDGGKNWIEVNQGLYNLNISVIVADPLNNQIVFVGTKKGIFKSINRGESWDEWFEETSGLDQTDIKKIVIDSSNSKKLYAVTQNETFFSKNGGESWKKIFTDIPSFNKNKEETAGSNDNLFSMDEKNSLEYINLSIPKIDKNSESLKMNLLKLVTEIHTGRFFGNYFYLIFDIASVSLIIISITGIYIFFNRMRVWQKQKERIEDLDKIDLIIDFNEKSDEISRDSKKIHHLAEHIKKHILACKMLSKNGNHKELKKIEAHINSIDTKLHQLMDHIKEANPVN